MIYGTNISMCNGCRTIVDYLICYADYFLFDIEFYIAVCYNLRIKHKGENYAEK